MLCMRFYLIVMTSLLATGCARGLKAEWKMYGAETGMETMYPFPPKIDVSRNCKERTRIDGNKVYWITLEGDFTFEEERLSFDSAHSRKALNDSHG